MAVVGEGATAELESLQRAIEHAPANPGPLAAGLAGWWTPQGWYVCAKCAGRIMARGCHLPRESAAVWNTPPKIYGVCCLCAS